MPQIAPGNHQRPSRHHDLDRVGVYAAGHLTEDDEALAPEGAVLLPETIDGDDEDEENQVNKLVQAMGNLEPDDNTKSFYFKRTKMSYLSKIPTGALLRIMADFGNECFIFI